MGVKVPKPDKIFVVVILAVLILVGGLLTAIIINNRFTTERQNQRAQQEQQQKQKEEEQKQGQVNKNRSGRLACISFANSAYDDYLKVNATSTSIGADGQTIYYMPQHNWDFAEKQKKDAYDNCYKQYPVN